jgi:hypothetical protein
MLVFNQSISLLFSSPSTSRRLINKNDGGIKIYNPNYQFEEAAEAFIILLLVLLLVESEFRGH